MTLNEAKKVLKEMIYARSRYDITTLSDENPSYLPDPETVALQTAIDCMEEGHPGRVTHELKLGWNFCDAVYSGRKTFELRKNDRGFQTGDRIRFTPIRFETNDAVDRYPPHPIQEKLYEITYILNGWGLTQDCVALAIREVTDV